MELLRRRRRVSGTFEIDFQFLCHALKIFSDIIRILEAKSFSATNVYGEMTGLKSNMKRRQQDSYFSFETACKEEQLGYIKFKNVSAFWTFLTFMIEH